MHSRKPSISRTLIRSLFLLLTLALARGEALAAGTETLVRSNLADPDVLIEGSTAYLVGTGNSIYVPIYRSTDGMNTFSFLRDYDPSSFGTGYKYCAVWAPDLTKIGTTYYLTFSASRVLSSQTCSDTNPTIYYATGSSLTSLGAPQELYISDQAPRSYPYSYGACPPQGCLYGMRIDSSIFATPTNNWVSYTWFTGSGNANATFDLGNPTAIIQNTYPVDPYEQGINEAPDIIQHSNGSYYFFYSSGVFNGHYRVHYIKSNTVQGLTRSAGSYPLTFPIYWSNGKLKENAGHSSVVKYGNDYYIFYHIGVFNSSGVITARHTYKSKLVFNADGSIQPLYEKLHNDAISVRYRNVHSGLCMDVSGGSYDPSANVQQWSCHTLWPEQWDQMDMGGGYFMIRNRQSGMCLELDGWNTNNGANVTQWYCHGGNNQLFKFIQASGGKMIQSKLSGRCVEVGGWSQTAGGNIIQWDCHGGNNQLWNEY